MSTQRPLSESQAKSEGNTGFSPPPYPYERLAAVRQVASAHEGGEIDCSIGTPCDPPPAMVREALANSNSERGYPTSQGSLDLRSAASRWVKRRFGVDLEPSEVTACVGTKEFVASSAHFLSLRSPERDTVLYPEIAYPSYAMGATLAGGRAVGVPALPDGRMDLALIDPSDRARALMLWVNSPANPRGALDDLEAAASWGRAAGVPVFSDECYCEFTWEGPARSILEHGLEGVVAVHSLSKRSNLAGIRLGFFAGDPEITSYLRSVRQHAGLMVPGPVQAAAALAFDDDEHVQTQREIYLRRLKLVAKGLEEGGFAVSLPAGAFYLWIKVPERLHDGWAMAEELASRCGLVVSPGDLYGKSAAGFVRIAVVQSDDRLALAMERLRETR